MQSALVVVEAGDELKNSCESLLFIGFENPPFAKVNDK
jgi:hypothetical protein